MAKFYKFLSTSHDAAVVWLLFLNIMSEALNYVHSDMPRLIQLISRAVATEESNLIYSAKKNVNWKWNVLINWSVTFSTYLNFPVSVKTKQKSTNTAEVISILILTQNKQELTARYK